MTTSYFRYRCGSESVRVGRKFLAFMFTGLGSAVHGYPTRGAVTVTPAFGKAVPSARNRDRFSAVTPKSRGLREPDGRIEELQ